MLLNKQSLNVVKACSKAESRFTLNGILVTPTETVATDGHRLVIVTTPQLSADTFPELEGFKPQDKFKPFILQAKDAIDIAAAIPKKCTIPVLANAAVAEDGKGGYQIGVTDLDHRRIFPIRPLSGNFPHWKRVLPKKEDATYRIALSARYLRDMMDQVIAFKSKDDRGSMVDITFHGRGDSPGAVKFLARNDDTGQDFTGILMPMLGGFTYAPAKEPPAEAGPAIAEVAAPPTAPPKRGKKAPAAKSNQDLALEILADIFEATADPKTKAKLM